MAEGPDPKAPFWPISKPYQATSTYWDPRIYGFSGAIFVDADQVPGWQSAKEYAAGIIREAGSDLPALINGLSRFDEAVSVQAASLLQQNNRQENFQPESIYSNEAFKRAKTAVKAGFARFIEEFSLTNQAGNK
jgi:hypothetical protein